MGRNLIPYGRPVVVSPLRRVGDTWSIDFGQDFCIHGGAHLGFSYDDPPTECSKNFIWSSGSKKLDLVAGAAVGGGLISLRTPVDAFDADPIAELSINGLKLIARADNRLRMPGHTSDPSSPVNGDRWRNSTSKVQKHQRETGTAADPSVLYTNTAAGTQILSTNSETNFSLTNSLPANSVVAGSCFLVFHGGVYSTDASVAVTHTFRAKWGSTTLAATAAMSTQLASANVAWSMMYLVLIVSTGASGTALCYGFVTNNRTHVTMGNASTVTVDTTSANLLQESIQMSVSDADNKITPHIRAVLQLW